jgi:hypothetical protein
MAVGGDGGGGVDTPPHPGTPRITCHDQTDTCVSNVPCLVVLVVESAQGPACRCVGWLEQGLLHVGADTVRVWSRRGTGSSNQAV